MDEEPENDNQDGGQFYNYLRKKIKSTIDQDTPLNETPVTVKKMLDYIAYHHDKVKEEINREERPKRFKTRSKKQIEPVDYNKLNPHS